MLNGTQIAEGKMKSSEPTYPTIGQNVICNGFPGKIVTVLHGQLEGMVEVRLRSGDVCVNAHDTRTIRLVKE